MERESFIFYKSFYEAIRNLADNIRLEVFTAITEYALYGKLPENLKPFAQGMFTLIKPNLDTNITRYDNGKKGGRKPKNAPVSPDTEPRVNPPQDSPAFTSFEQEAELIKAEQIWSESVCMQFHIDKAELDKRLDAFVTHCKVERDKELHPSLKEAKRHFTSWMRKAYPERKSKQQPQPDDYTYNGGFGGID